MGMRKRPPGAKRIGKPRTPEPFRREGYKMPPYVPLKERDLGMREMGDKRYYRPEVGSVWEDETVPSRYVMVEGTSGFGPYGTQWARGKQDVYRWKAKWVDFTKHFVLRINAVSCSKKIEKQYFGRDKVER